MHVLGTPPAFVLSQDQTLHRDLARPEPGFDRLKSRFGAWSPSPTGTKNVRCCPLSVQLTYVTTVAARGGARGHPHWLLAVPIPFSRSDDETHLLSQGGACALYGTATPDPLSGRTPVPHSSHQEISTPRRPVLHVDLPPKRGLTLAQPSRLSNQPGGFRALADHPPASPLRGSACCALETLAHVRDRRDRP